MTRDKYLSILRAELLKRLNQNRVAEIVSEWESHFAIGSAKMAFAIRKLIPRLKKEMV
jgi:uncharacterized membrane protein